MSEKSPPNLDDFLPEWVKRQSGGRPYITAQLFAAMGWLIAQGGGEGFVSLEGILHQRTINALVERDWIVPSLGTGNLEYGVTSRGLKDYAYYAEPPTERNDGICPACGVRPKSFSSNGSPYGYCPECRREQQAAHRRLKGRQRSNKSICPRCKKEQVHCWSSGKPALYCRACLTIVKREENRRRMARLKAELASESPPLCVRCKSAPRYSTGRTVFDYCADCLRVVQVEYKKKKYKYKKK